ncbi:MAG: hypothetical protein QM767_04135 [Anaeromyxobacter sp.]
MRLVADGEEVPADELGLRPLKGFPEPVELFRVARTGSGVEEPPYGGRALARVAGLARPDPARLARSVRRRERALYRGLAALRGGKALAALALVGLLAFGGWFWWAGLWKDPERLAAEGRFERARQAIEARAARLGPESPRILYLRARLEAARADADAGGKLDEAFKLWSRALAKGSREARAALASEAASASCQRRLLAARALVDAHTQLAREPLEALARAEPAEQRSSLFAAAGNRCGAGDVAREGLAELEGAGQLP